MMVHTYNPNTGSGCRRSRIQVQFQLREIFISNNNNNQRKEKRKRKKGREGKGRERKFKVNSFSNSWVFKRLKASIPSLWLIEYATACMGTCRGNTAYGPKCERMLQTIKSPLMHQDRQSIVLWVCIRTFCIVLWSIFHYSAFKT